MKIIDVFERSFQRLMEGSIGRVFNSPIQPAEIGRKLERAMLDHRVTSTNATIVPNAYRVAMNPQDMVHLADYINGLNRQMEEWLTQVAATNQYTLIDHIRVEITGEDKVPRRTIRVQATISDRPDASARAARDVRQRTEIYRVIEQQTGMPPQRLRLLNGPRQGDEVIIRNPVTTLGRAFDNDIVLEGGEVSRHHARLERNGHHLHVIDLDSTNGTRVNGRPIRSHLVQPGDHVTFGGIQTQLLPFDSSQH
ncbi:MAG TPA: DUF3662 and FHA domain-containing protein [Thermomicrobiales bacterium]|nr:DUF3662 and FHA domain-containing protein [Thermomicrobiales bacterium]